MNLDWNSGALAEGLRCYRGEEFFEAHEHWEAIWLQCEEPEKTFLQALIQITAAFHHLRRNNKRGAKSLLTRALRRLEAYPAEYAGVPVAALRTSVTAWLLALEQADPAASLAFPGILTTEQQRGL